MDWTDRGTCVLFRRDGAGALIVEPQEGAGTARRPRHPVDPILHSTGATATCSMSTAAVLVLEKQWRAAHGRPEVFRPIAV